MKRMELKSVPIVQISETIRSYTGMVFDIPINLFSYNFNQNQINNN